MIDELLTWNGITSHLNECFDIDFMAACRKMNLQGRSSEPRETFLVKLMFIDL